MSLPFRSSSARRLALVALALLLGGAGRVGAQDPQELRAGVTSPVDTATRADTLLPLPPLSPRRAFLTSLAVPGYAQAQLQRPTASVLFFTVEAVSVAMLRKSLRDLQVAKRFVGDSVPAAVERDPETGELVVTAWSPSRYTSELVRARRLHLEDWIAALIFNHLIAGADAFVVAQLWDVPAGVSMSASSAHAGRRLRVAARLHW